MKSLDYLERNTWSKFKNILRDQFTVSPGRLEQLENDFTPHKSEKEDVRSFLFMVRNKLN